MLTLDSVIESLVPEVFGNIPLMTQVMLDLPRTSLLVFIKHLLQYLSLQYLSYATSQLSNRWWDADRSRVGAAASLLYELHQDQKLATAFVDLVKRGTGVDSCPIQRVCVLTISVLGKDLLSSFVNYMLAQWADKLSINHTPVTLQEGISMPSIP